MGQDVVNELPLLDGTSRSVIWTEGGDVLGFFRYAPRNSLLEDRYIGIAADEFI